MGLRKSLHLEPGSCACSTETNMCECAPTAERLDELQVIARNAHFAMLEAEKSGDRAAAARHRASMRAALAELGGTSRPANTAPKHDHANAAHLDDESAAAAKLRDYVSDRWRNEP